jgi:lauroyl/myristoyl acyltransferase
VIRRVRARCSRSLSLGLAWLASLSPRFAFLTCDVLAVFLAMASLRPTRSMLRTLFPHLSSREVGRVLRRIKANYARNLLLGGWILRGGRTSTLTRVQDNDAVRALRAPMIVSTFHIGPTLALGVLSEWLQGESLVLRGRQQGTDQDRAVTFHRAIERLRANGFVILALDPHEAHRIAAPFLGGTLQLARGPFAMARVARAPIVPVVARWIGNEIELVVGEPLHGGDDEQALAASAGRWLGEYLGGRPEELSSRILELLRT